VVAESFEAARAAARAVRATIEAEPGRYGYDMMAGLDEASGPPRDSRLQDIHKGDLDAAIAEAVATVDATYTTPNQVHAAMEPHASVA
ncbi:molybdopterin cofactor-binding domain-containing protein, partial [Acinetobacter baumannii]